MFSFVSVVVVLIKVMIKYKWKIGIMKNFSLGRKMFIVEVIEIIKEGFNFFVNKGFCGVNCWSFE